LGVLGGGIVPQKKRGKRYKYVGRRYSIRTLLVFLVLVLTAYFFFQSPYFDVSSIAVAGNSNLSSEEAVKLSGINKGTNIFRVDIQSVKEKILLHPFVASVELKRDLPDTIRIQVVEYVPAAVVPFEGGFMVVSKEGYCLRHCNEISNLDLPVVSGLGMKDGVPPGTKVDNERLPVALEIVNCCEKKESIAEIEVRDVNKIIVFTFSQTRILLGNDEKISEKMSLALDIASKVPNAEYIDVRFPKSPVYK
jgi:cell division protein FtsQ